MVGWLRSTKLFVRWLVAVAQKLLKGEGGMWVCGTFSDSTKTSGQTKRKSLIWKHWIDKSIMGNYFHMAVNYEGRKNCKLLSQEMTAPASGRHKKVEEQLSLIANYFHCSAVVTQMWKCDFWLWLQIISTCAPTPGLNALLNWYDCVLKRSRPASAKEMVCGWGKSCEWGRDSGDGGMGQWLGCCRL